MEKNGHNGWTNYETWVVALWIDQDHGSYKYWRETAAEARSVAADCPQVADGIWSKKDAGRFQLADWLKEKAPEIALYATAGNYIFWRTKAEGEQDAQE